MADGYFITSSEVQRVEVWQGVYRRTLATTDEAMLCEFFLVAGAYVTPHSHMNDQVGYVVSGQLEMSIGAITQILNPGDSYAIPGGIEHSARALIDSIVIDAFSPPRQDYRTEAR